MTLPANDIDDEDWNHDNLHLIKLKQLEIYIYFM